MRYYIILIALLISIPSVFSQDSESLGKQVRLNNHKIAELKYRLKNLELLRDSERDLLTSEKDIDSEVEDSLALPEADKEEVVTRKSKRNRLKDKVDDIKRGDTLVLSRLAVVEKQLDTVIVELRELKLTQQVQLDRIESYLLALANNQSVNGLESSSNGNRHVSGKKKELHDFFENQRVNLDKHDTLNNRLWDYFVVVDTYTELNYAKFLQKKLRIEYGIGTTLTQSGKSSSPYFLVWSKKITTKEDALKEVNRLNNSIDAEYLPEGAWLYHRRKKL